MSRLTRFSFVLLGASLLFLTLTFLSANGKQIAQAMHLATNNSPVCYTWSFQNNTDQDVNDLHLRLSGVVDLTNVYTGTLNPFGVPAPTSGYDPGTQTYTLNFSNTLVYTGEAVTVGFCSNTYEAHLAPSADPAYWTLDGQPLQPAPTFVGVKWKWQDAYHLKVTLQNSNNFTVTVQMANLLDPDVALSLEDLTNDIAAMLPMASELAPDVLTLSPGNSITFDAPITVAAAPMNSFLPQVAFLPMHTYVLQALLAAEDDPGNTVYLISQSDSPPMYFFLPLIRH